MLCDFVLVYYICARTTHQNSINFRSFIQIITKLKVTPMEQTDTNFQAFATNTFN